MFDNNKQKALQELLEVLEKGVNLLENGNLDKDLYEAYEKYALSTVKMVYEAYNSTNLLYFIEEYGCMPSNDWSQYYMNPNSIFRRTQSFPALNSAASVYASCLSQYNNTSTEYRDKLMNLLKRLVYIAKMVVYE